ncbi:hypothetical protein BJEO58_01648 [Brevibacterium jeotgali]|uniref:Uncharacterized protein n=1 Tax=Brevibacterium jeotgali TaxID=1262550 RepID=A0A2H1L572_9MICO|nr:hypothetical protein [Brevibacterium jeotgali]TWB98494.1 hypothetical protein FB108_2383 [Brevibacterium jeotgali]SMY12054.1 hypothetical protein BJEO58_01648 [Brevibacterium jeotgali]
MCRSASCPVCGKTTWAGCGQHIDQVKRTVPAGNWCPGHNRAAAPASTRRPGLLTRLFQR